MQAPRIPPPPPAVVRLAEATAFSETSEIAATCSTVSNRPKDERLRVVYINGMNTSRGEAEKDCGRVARHLGVDRPNVKLLYNRPEHNAYMGLVKVTGGMVSSRLGESMERDCVSALREHVELLLDSPGERLVVVGHSQGSLIFQNATDECFAACSKSASGRKRWTEGARRIEGLFYAPVVRHVAPGLDVVGFTYESDFSGRGGAAVSQLFSGSKASVGWKPYQKMKVLVARRTENLISEVLKEPWASHSCLSHALQEACFHVAHYETAHDGARSPELLAARLAYSIRHGLRSDALHHEMIELSMRQSGEAFCRHFLARMKIEKGIGWIGAFRVEPAMVLQLQHAKS